MEALNPMDMPAVHLDAFLLAKRSIESDGPLSERLHAARDYVLGLLEELGNVGHESRAERRSERHLRTP